jgi:hypothetical protein
MLRRCPRLLMTMTGGPGARGLTIADVRTRIHTPKKRASGPMHAISLIESEMALLHLLARSGRPKAYEECLQLAAKLPDVALRPFFYPENAPKWENIVGVT